MKSNNVSKLRSFTLGEMLAAAKLMQMLTHRRQFDDINELTLNEYLRTSFGWSEEEASDMIRKSRRACLGLLQDVDAE